MTWDLTRAFGLETWLGSRVQLTNRKEDQVLYNFSFDISIKYNFGQDLLFNNYSWDLIRLHMWIWDLKLDVNDSQIALSIGSFINLLNYLFYSRAIFQTFLNTHFGHLKSVWWVFYNFKVHDYCIWYLIRLSYSGWCSYHFCRYRYPLQRISEPKQKGRG